MIKISFTNTKLGDKIPSLNLPTTICRCDAPCKKGCYAKKGHWLYPNVVKSLQNNLDAFLEDKEKFFNDVIEFINNEDTIYKFFRWFSSGDIVNYEFLLGMIEVAKKSPNTNFLCFTKKFELVNVYLDFNGGELPKNLSIIFSHWDNTFKVDNPHNLPCTFINFKDKSKNDDIPEYAIPCKGSCKSCKSCWSLKRGQSVYFDIH